MTDLVSVLLIIGAAAVGPIGAREIPLTDTLRREAVERCNRIYADSVVINDFQGVRWPKDKWCDPDNGGYLLTMVHRKQETLDQLCARAMMGIGSSVESAAGVIPRIGSIGNPGWDKKIEVVCIPTPAGYRR